MLAIHNYSFLTPILFAAANAFAKLSKCQQFTTITNFIILLKKLQTLLQSYQNVSNSQLTNILAVFTNCCKRFCKVIKMLAIHNCKLLISLAKSAANAFAKLSKCQQFTTLSTRDSKKQALQTLLQSYQNVSNSQLSCCQSDTRGGCKRFCKVIKMLAIHNHNELHNTP